MRHCKSYGKLKRESSHRKAFLRNLATSLVINGRIVTTLTRAKQLRVIVEKLITKGKKNSLTARRSVAGYLYGCKSTQKVCNELSTRFNERPGGYTRIVKFGPRFGDGAFMSALELVDYKDHEGKIAKQKKLENKKTQQETTEEVANAPK